MPLRPLFAAILLCCLVVLPACPVWAAEPIKIGVVVSASGPAAFLGEPEKNTAEMAADMINAQGGILGRPVELVVYDDETDINKSVLAVEKLLKKDRVAAVVGPTTSGNTLAVMPKVAAAKVPMVSMAAAEKITNPINHWIFKVAPSDRHAVQRIYAHMQAQGMQSVAIITVSNGFGQAGREVLKELAEEYGLALRADEVFAPNDTDMTAQLTAIKTKNPDAIICWGTNPGPAVVARNRQQLGIATPLFMSHGVASKKFIELAGDAAEGLKLPAGRLIVAEQLPADHPQKQLLEDYIQAYETRFEQPVSTFGGHARDAMHLLKLAMETAGSAEPAAIRDALEAISGFVGTAGTFTFSPDDHNGLSLDAFSLVEIKDGAWKLIP